MKTKTLLIVLSVAALFFLAGCTQSPVNPPQNTSLNLTNDCEKNGGTCTVLGDFAVDTCEMHNWTTLPYRQSCPNLAVNTQCCKKEPNACTQEALQCSDGSYVARTGPNCTFAPCPNCTCPQGYIQEADLCNPACYYNTPKCLMPSVHCNSNLTNNTTCTSPSGERMGINEAKQIAQASECTEYGTLTDTPECNNFTGSWWFMLDLYNKTDLCRVACNVYTENKTAEIVWMCTGVIPDEDLCVRSGGNVTTRLCCNSVGNFPDTCLIGACGCSPDNSHQVKVCDCGEGRCWDSSRMMCMTPTPVIPANVSGAVGVVAANNQFAFDLYSQYSSQQGNIFFSPYSISTALAMTYEGARGGTAQEMQSVFHFPIDNNTRRNGFLQIYNEINYANKSYNLSTANALWAQKDYKFLDSYIGLIRTYYGGNVTNLDFVGDTENSREIINNWVAEQTNGKITNIIPEGAIDSLTRLVITNAVYFKASWYIPFFNATDDDFTVSPNKTVKVKMMYLDGDSAETYDGNYTDLAFNYAETDEAQILELPYAGNDVSMLVILPKGDNLQTLEQSLSADKLNQWKGMLKETEMRGVYIPRFKFETTYSMAGTLENMGMKKAFNPDEADFSGMDGTRNLSITSVIHKAFIEVNETGTEAAAATVVIIGATAMPVQPAKPLFRADHPFIFIIQQKDTGNILFMGRVSDPTSET